MMGPRLPAYSWILGSVGQGIQSKYSLDTGRAILNYTLERKKTNLEHCEKVAPDLVSSEFGHRNKLFQEATRAYKSGEKHMAHNLSQRALDHAKKAQALSLKVSQQVFWEKNGKRDLYREIDLHGIYAFEAVSTLAVVLLQVDQPYRVITGPGKGSLVEPVLSRAVTEFCQSRGYLFEHDGTNRGALILRHLNKTRD